MKLLDTGEKKQKKSRTWNRVPLILLIISVVMLIVVCLLEPKEETDGGETSQSASKESVVAVKPGTFDSRDTAVLVEKNEEESSLTFFNLEVEKNYTLYMDGATKFYDKYGDTLSLSQLKPGDVVDLTFFKENKRLVSMQLSGNAWSNRDVENYEFDQSKSQVSIGSEVYKLTSATRYFSADGVIELMDINTADTLSFQGIGNRILSVRVEKGHGYLRLENDMQFIGGWIEIGQSRIQKISEDMLLVVPEGNYQVTISNRGGGGVKNVVIYRDEETTLDIGDLEVPEPETGIVLFSLTPADAQLYIDGTQVNTSYPLVLEYGLHQMIVRAEGYQSITQYIRVSQESAGINVVLDSETSEKEDTSSENQTTTTDYYKIYIDAPQSVEVYINGNYIGTAPCSFPKEEGSYIVTLRKAGYETRSYTITVDASEKDLSYSFADLEQNTLTNQ